MPKRIPIAAAKRVAKEQGLRQVILIAIDNDRIEHVVTYGRTHGDCTQAAQGGNLIKRVFGWAADLCAARPSRAPTMELFSPAIIERLRGIGPYHPIDEMPPRTGRYILCHRGHAVITHYLHPETPWHIGTLLKLHGIGWQVRPESFNATHWAELPELDP